MTPGPDSLRALKVQTLGYACPTCGGTEWVCAEESYAHADAWEAERKGWQEAEALTASGVVALREALAQRSIEHLEALSANHALRKAINNLAICPLCNRDIGTGEKHLPGCLAALASQPEVKP